MTTPIVWAAVAACLGLGLGSTAHAANFEQSTIVGSHNGVPVLQFVGHFDAKTPFTGFSPAAPVVNWDVVFPNTVSLEDISINAREISPQVEPSQTPQAPVSAPSALVPWAGYISLLPKAQPRPLEAPDPVEENLLALSQQPDTPKPAAAPVAMEATTTLSFWEALKAVGRSDNLSTQIAMAAAIVLLAWITLQYFGIRSLLFSSGGDKATSKAARPVPKRGGNLWSLFNLKAAVAGNPASDGTPYRFSGESTASTAASIRANMHGFLKRYSAAAGGVTSLGASMDNANERREARLKSLKEL